MYQSPFQWDKNTQGLISLRETLRGFCFVFCLQEVVSLYCFKCVDIHVIALQKRELPLSHAFCYLTMIIVLK